jgi:hypothetical protein
MLSGDFMLRKTQAALLTSILIFCSTAFMFATDETRDVPTWVQARVEALRPTAADRKFDEIGWANSIVDAEKLARQNNRPVFLFTQNGRIEIGRT